MTNVISLDSKRPQRWETMRCLFCGNDFVLKHPAQSHKRYWGHPPDAEPGTSCDEVASVPRFRWEMGKW